jgi:hypothetical protein
VTGFSGFHKKPTDFQLGFQSMRPVHPAWYFGKVLHEEAMKVLGTRYISSFHC